MEPQILVSLKPKREMPGEYRLGINDAGEFVVWFYNEQTGGYSGGGYYVDRTVESLKEAIAELEERAGRC